MKSDWKFKNFEDCIEKTIYTKKVPRTGFLKSGKFPIISQEQEFINGYWNHAEDLFKIKKPVVIFGDHTQIVKYVDFDFVLGADGVKIIQPIADFNSKYFYYYIINTNIKKLGYARHYRLLKSIKIPLPPLPTQQRIVAILDEAFDAIAKAKENTEKNLQNTREVFNSYLDNIFANPKEDWEEKRLGEIFEIERGGSPRPIDSFITDSPDGINWVKIGDTKDITKYIYHTKEKIKPEGVKKSRIVNDGDFILSNSMSFGHPYIMKTTGCIHDGWLVLRKKETDINQDFLYFVLGSDLIYKQFDSLAAGSTVRNLNIGLVKKVQIPLPPLPTQQTIVAKLDELSAETKRLEAIYQKKLADLEELKKSILQKAFNGELTD